MRPGIGPPPAILTFATTPVDAAPPAVRITAPLDGSAVSGSVTISADAFDDVAVTAVELLLDGVSVGGPQTTAPYSVKWDSTAGADGTHVISARALDAAGHVTTSAVATVTVNNPLQVVDFNTLTNIDEPLSGEYPAGVVDWLSDAWLLSGPWGQLTTNSVSFSSSTTFATSLRLVTPKRLVSLTAFNGGMATSTVTLGCSGNPLKTATIEPNEIITIITGWTANCSTVTISSANGWETNFDDFAFDIAR